MVHLVKEERKSITATFNIGVTVAYPDTKKKRPAVLLIMGTGKTDRDGNERGFHTDIYKNLSHMFVEQGFVCVRYDKRGTYETKGSYSKAGLHDLMDDAVSVLQFTKSLPYVDEQKVIICGHSEGAMIATLFSQNEKTAGLILLGGAGICLKDALLYQNRRASKEFQIKKGMLGWLLRRQTTEEKTNARVETMFRKCMATNKDTLFFSGTVLNAKWVREHGLYTSEDFIDLLKQYPNPVLAITGTEDLSVDYTSLQSLTNAINITTLTPQGMNHIWRDIDDDNSFLSVKKQYKRLSQKPINSETEHQIKEWLKQHYFQ